MENLPLASRCRISSINDISPRHPITKTYVVRIWLVLRPITSESTVEAKIQLDPQRVIGSLYTDRYHHDIFLSREIELLWRLGFQSLRNGTRKVVAVCIWPTTKQKSLVPFKTKHISNNGSTSVAVFPMCLSRVSVWVRDVVNGS